MNDVSGAGVGGYRHLLSIDYRPALIVARDHCPQIIVPICSYLVNSF